MRALTLEVVDDNGLDLRRRCGGAGGEPENLRRRERHARPRRKKVSISPFPLTSIVPRCSKR
jgi:hypothetical protein